MKTRSRRKLFCALGLACAGLILLGSLVSAQVIRARDETSRTLSIENVAVNGDTVSGEVVNHSRTNTLRDVQVLIRYIWLWDKETKPGRNDPSTSTYYTVPGPIAPGGRASFSYTLASPLGKPAGGHFETSAAIAGFTEVIPGTR